MCLKNTGQDILGLISDLHFNANETQAQDQDINQWTSYI